MVEDEPVRLAQPTDSAALEEICRREWRPVYHLIYRTVQNRAEAQDLTQEVFLRALRSFDRLELTGGPIHSYLVTIALNLLRDRWRRRVQPSADLDSLLHLSATAPGPEQLVLADLDKRAIYDALATLPEDYQSVIRLRVLESRSSHEVGAVMGRNGDAVRQLQRRALQALRAALREESLT
jgi:RNA polymerase sigma-70 factor (ECF subfamily)